MPPSPPSAPFRLLPWFAMLGAVVIALIAWANAWLVSSFLTRQLLEREAAVSREFVQNILVSDGSLAYLAAPGSAPARERFLGSIVHLQHLPDVLRANVYGRDRTVLWSSDPQLTGRRFGANAELDQAMRGELVVHAGRIAAESAGKREYEGLSPAADFFVETYIPVRLPGAAQVDGVVELYKAPLALTAAIHEGRRQVALTALGGALLLYFSLFGLVRRADRTLRRQHEQLRHADTAAVMAELAASVAHNIRNPLASIRSSAELSLEAPQEHTAENASDILRQVDRISARIDELLRLSGQGGAAPQVVDLAALLAGCVADHQATFSQRQQTLVFENRAAHSPLRTDPQLLQQVLHSVLANASEAMTAGQRCEVALCAAPAGGLRIEVRDGGAGLTPAQRAQVFRPFFTTKPQGLGLGLPLAQRIVERLGGRLQLDSQPGAGTTVCIDLPEH